MSFEGMHEDGWKFLVELTHQNERSWFESQKARYQAHLKKPAEALMAQLCDSLQAITKKEMSGKIFRIYRDVRFSKDKTPYNTHLRMGLTAASAPAPNPAFFFSLEPDKLVLGAGVFDFDKPSLDAFRQAVVSAKGEKFDGIIKGLKSSGYHMYEPVLKKIPKGYPADHPRAHWLRHKSITSWWEDRVPKEIFTPDAAEFCMKHFRKLAPLNAWLTDLQP